MSTGRTGFLLRGIQIVVTVGLMGVLLGQIDWSGVLPLFVNARWSLVAGSVGCLLFCHLINIVRWRYVLDQPTVGLNTLMLFYGAGLFSNNFLPSGIGGDGVRAVLLGRVIPLRRALLSVALDRGSGLVGLVSLLMAGFVVDLPPMLTVAGNRLVDSLSESWHISLVLLVTTILGLSLIYWRSSRFQSAFGRLQIWLVQDWDLPPWTIAEWLKRLAGSYLLSVISSIGLVVATWFVLQAIEVIVPPEAVLWVVILSSLSLLFPIAVNGMGVVEGVYVVVLSGYGVPATASLGSALLIRILGLLVSLAGGLALLQRRVPVFEVKG